MLDPSVGADVRSYVVGKPVRTTSSDDVVTLTSDAAGARTRGEAEFPMLKRDALLSRNELSSSVNDRDGTNWSYFVTENVLINWSYNSKFYTFN